MLPSSLLVSSELGAISGSVFVSIAVGQVECLAVAVALVKGRFFIASLSAMVPMLFTLQLAQRGVVNERLADASWPCIFVYLVLMDLLWWKLSGGNKNDRKVFMLTPHVNPCASTPNLYPWSSKCFFSPFL